MEGSPPPTRGTLPELIHADVLLGITPAYAGNTDRHLQGAGRHWDHPRLRGEHLIESPPDLPPVGSPPPTRGTLTHLEFGKPAGGITPAYAGNTRHRAGAEILRQDHPRLRGEHIHWN